MQKLRGIILLAGFASLTLPLMPLQWLFKVFSPQLARSFPHYYHRLLARLLGFHVTCEGEKPLAPSLLVGNHVSWIDIVVLSAALPVSFVAKREVHRWPFFGQLASLQNTIFINRERRSTTGQSRDELAARLARGDHIMLFPEGTSHDGNSVLPFRSSFFAPGENSACPVVPVTLAYRNLCGLPMTRRRRPLFAWYGDMELPAHLWQAVQQGPIAVTIRFHQALPQGPRKALAKQAETAIAAALSELLHGRAEIG